MNDFWKFIRRTWWLFFLLFIAPLIIIFVFFIDEYILHRIDMSAGEWANLLSATFGYWGTVLLGVLAFWQNERTSLINERLFAFEDINKKIANTPILKIIGCEIFSDNNYKSILIEDNNFRGNYNYIAKFNNVSIDFDHAEFYIVVKNDSSSKICNLTYNGIGYIKPQELKSHVKLVNKQICIDSLEQYSEVDLNINPMIQNKMNRYEINIEYYNIYNHRFTQSILLIAIDDAKDYEVYIRQYIH